MLAIAILALIKLVIGIISELIKQQDKPNGFGIITAINTIAWWNISLPLAIVLLIIGIVWMIVIIAIRIQD